MKERTFSTAYRSDLAASYIWIPLTLGSILGLIGLAVDTFIFTIASAVFTSIAVWHWPFSDSGRIVLRLSNKGVDIDGIGRLPWSGIQQVELIEKRKKTQSPSEFCSLRITLNQPVDELVQPFAPMARPKWQKQLTKQINETTLCLAPGRLLDSQINIANAFAWFLKPMSK